jgi:hypothetical protein
MVSKACPKFAFQKDGKDRNKWQQEFCLVGKVNGIGFEGNTMPRLEQRLDETKLLKTLAMGPRIEN